MNCKNQSSNLPTKAVGASPVEFNGVSVHIDAVKAAREIVSVQLSEINQIFSDEHNKLLSVQIGGSLARNMSDDFSHDIDTICITVPSPATPLNPYKTAVRQQKELHSSGVMVDLITFPIIDHFKNVFNGKIGQVELLYSPESCNVQSEPFLNQVNDAIKQNPTAYVDSENLYMGVWGLIQNNKLYEPATYSVNPKAFKLAGMTIFYNDFVNNLLEGSLAYENIETDYPRMVKQGKVPVDMLAKQFFALMTEHEENKGSISKKCPLNERFRLELSNEITLFTLGEQQKLIHQK